MESPAGLKEDALAECQTEGSGDMVKKIALALGLGVFLMGSTAAFAGTPPDALCKDKKFKATGKNALDLLKAFGKNKKKKNAAKLASDLSKAQSKVSKGFTKAEWTGKGDSRGCTTTNDVGAIENKVEAFVDDVITELCPSPSGAFVDGLNGSLY
jgi:hypothetical protein